MAKSTCLVFALTLVRQGVEKDETKCKTLIAVEAEGWVYLDSFVHA